MLVLLLACVDPDADAFPAPSVRWITPAAGEHLVEGEHTCSLSVDEFLLKSPAKHGGDPEGLASGFLAVTLDGEPAFDTWATMFRLDLPAGEHELGVQLFYLDGDEVTVTGSRICDEGDEGCEPVAATIEVLVE